MIRQSDPKVNKYHSQPAAETALSPDFEPTAMVRLWSGAPRGGWRSTVVIRMGPLAGRTRTGKVSGIPREGRKGFKKPPISPTISKRSRSTRHLLGVHWSTGSLGTGCVGLATIPACGLRQSSFGDLRTNATPAPTMSASSRKVSILWWRLDGLGRYSCHFPGRARTTKATVYLCDWFRRIRCYPLALEVQHTG